MPTFINQNGVQLGPFQDAEVLDGLTRGIYLGSDFAWREGMATWQPLQTIFPSSAGAPPLPGLPAKRMGDDAGMRMLLPVGRSGWAIVSGYLGLVSVLVFPAPFAVFTALMAFRSIKASRHTAAPKFGMGRATFGLVMGIIGSAVLIYLLVSYLNRRH